MAIRPVLQYHMMEIFGNVSLEISRSDWLDDIHSTFLKPRSGWNTPFRGIVYELARFWASRDVVGGMLCPREGVLLTRGSSHIWRPGFALGGGGVGGGSHDALHGCRCLCLLGSLSLYRILKVTFCDCIPIKMNIIQAGFSIMYSLLLYLFFLLILEKWKLRHYYRSLEIWWVVGTVSAVPDGKLALVPPFLSALSIWKFSQITKQARRRRPNILSLSVSPNCFRWGN